MYWNTIVNGVLLKTLSQCGVPILCHVHELEQIILSFGLENFLNIKECAEFYIAASEAVKDNLVQRHGLPPNFIEVVYGFPSGQNLNSKFCAAKRSCVRHALGISEAAFVVIGAGMIEAHKGPDLFVQLANYVNTSYRRRILTLFGLVNRIMSRFTPTYLEILKKPDAVKCSFLG